MRIAILFLMFWSLATAQTTKTISLMVGGINRSFVLHVPSEVSNPALVLFVHGYGGNGTNFANDTKADGIADREKFIAAYPSSNGLSWSMYDTTEYPFLLAVVDTIDAMYKIDRNRVFCAGFSQGGFISFGLGYKHPEVFAAVAPVSGHLPSFSTTAALPRPVPLFLTFGTNDRSDVASFMTDIATWKRLNNCTGAPVVERPYPSNNSHSTVSRTTFNCDQGSEVVYDSVITGGHEWAMDTYSKVNTTEEVWKFFQKHPKRPPVPQGPFIGATPVPGIIQAENYDIGGEGVAYHDNDAANNGGLYRNDGVDITGDSATGYKVGWTVEGEWLEYSIQVATTGFYDWSASISMGGDSAAFHFSIDGKAITPRTIIPSTGSWDTYASISGTNVELSAGPHILRLDIDRSYANFDWFSFVPHATTGIHPAAKAPVEKAFHKIHKFDLNGRRIGSGSLD